MNYYTVEILICLVTLVILDVLVWENDRIRKEDKKLFYLANALIMAAAFMEWAGVQLSASPDYPRWMLRAVKCADYILTPLAGWALVQPIKPRGVIQKLMVGTLIFNTILQIITVFTDWMIVIDASNRYTHGVLYPAYIACYAAIIVMVLVTFGLYSRGFRRRNMISLHAIVTFGVVCIAVQEISSSQIRISYLGVTICAVLLFIHFTEYAQQKSDEEIARQHANILVLQMRPHFIYNTMTSIYHLCAQDAEKAQQVTLDFTEYLRRNLTAITQEGTIPFIEELEHARAYLDVEKVRFEDKLFIEYQTAYTAFNIPPLTLQPIVENAVKHGVSPGLKPLYLTIITREAEKGVELIVEDTGPGFGKADNDEPHIALKNIRERLDMMCVGTLTVAARPEGGTAVTVFIPQQRSR